MAARGNNDTYPHRGRNWVEGALQWAPFSGLNAIAHGFWTRRPNDYSDGFHVYQLEWTDKFIRISVDNGNMHEINMNFDKTFFKRGKFPATVTNGTGEEAGLIDTPDPWATNYVSKNAAPFDQRKYRAGYLCLQC